MPPIAEYTTAVVPWPKHLHTFLPAPVRAASAGLQTAIDHLADAERNLHAHRADAEAAQAADKTAARTAVEAGKVPPTSDLPAVLDGVERAVRAVEARTELAREAQNHFVAVQLSNLGETTGSIRARQSAVVAVLDSRLTEVAAGLNELQALAHVLAELEGGVLRHKRQPSFKPVRAVSRRPRDLGAEAVEPIRDAVGERAGDNMFITGQAA